MRTMSDIAPQDRRRSRSLGRLPGSVDQRLHQHAQRRHRVRHAQAPFEAAQWARTTVRRGDRRTGPERADSSASIKDAYHRRHSHPPPVIGLGTARRLQAARSRTAAPQATTRSTRPSGRAVQAEGGVGNAGARTDLLGLQINVPQLVRRRRPRRGRSSSACRITDVFSTMQIYLGSLYVNDFNKFRPRTYQVFVAGRRAVPRA